LFQDRRVFPFLTNFCYFAAVSSITTRQPDGLATHQFIFRYLVSVNSLPPECGETKLRESAFLSGNFAFLGVISEESYKRGGS